MSAHTNRLANQEGTTEADAHGMSSPQNHVDEKSAPASDEHNHAYKPNHISSRGDFGPGQGDFPIAICGMALRLPGGLESPQQLWDFLIAKGDARGRVPESRYNVSAYHTNVKQRGSIATEHGYFLASNVELGSFDASRFSFNRSELEAADPQHRLMLEVVRESLDDAGEVNFRGKPIGCYMGCYGEDWLEMQNKDPLQTGTNRVDGYGDFMLSNRVSYEMDLRGPSMTVRTACSSALVGLHEAVVAIQHGECDSAIIGGSNLILTPRATAFMNERGFLAPDGSCKTFSADADGYVRAEGVLAVYIKPLDTAIRDGNPIRAVIRSTTINSDGKTPGITQPDIDAHETLIRKAYSAAGIQDYSQTAFVECHGTGTAIGDPIEVNAVARVFGDEGVYIGSVKPNLGHAEGASALTSVIKAVLSLEHRTIPPNIKFSSPNPKIPFKERKLSVPLEPMPWPESRHERISVNSFGVGGTNAHLILDSAASFGIQPHITEAEVGDDHPRLLLFSASTAASLQNMVQTMQTWATDNPDHLKDLAYTLANRREYLAHRSFMVTRKYRAGAISAGRRTAHPPRSLVMVFTGQGAQWPRMGRHLLLRPGYNFRQTIESLDTYLKEIPDAPEWTLVDELQKPANLSGIWKAELAQPLCTAVQVGLFDLFASVGVKPSAVVGHSSGEIAAAYAAGALTAREAIVSSWRRGTAAKLQTKAGAMAAIGLGWDDVRPFISSNARDSSANDHATDDRTNEYETDHKPGVIVACENSPKNVTLSGDADEVNETLAQIQKAHPDIVARLVKVDKAYHSYHMREIGAEYYSKIIDDITGKQPQIPFYSSVTGHKYGGLLDATYWQRNLESPVLFRSAISEIIEHNKNLVFLEIGAHPAFAGPVRQILAQTAISAPYVGAMSRNEDSAVVFLEALGTLFELDISVDWKALMPHGRCLPDLPHYPWDHQVDYWQETRISQQWRRSKFLRHPLLGTRTLESTDLEPVWRNLLYVDEFDWVKDHRIDGNVVLPAAGYICIIGEAIRQLSGSSGGFALRHVLLHTGLVLPEQLHTELVTTFHPHRLTDSLDSPWWDFTIASHNGDTWIKHCHGQASSKTLDRIEPLELPLPLPRTSDRYYEYSEKSGIQFGPQFRRLTDLRTGTLECIGAARIKDDPKRDENRYHLHPTIIDACIQLTVPTALRADTDSKRYNVVPTKIDHVTIDHCPSRAKLSASCSASYNESSGQALSKVQQVFADGKVVMHMEGLELSPLGQAERTQIEDIPTALLKWGPHIDFLDISKLIKPEIPRHIWTPLLEQLTQLCIVYSHRHVKDAQTAIPHLKKYQGWILDQVGKMEASRRLSIEASDDSTIMTQVETLIHQMADSPVAGCAMGVRKVVTNIEALFSSELEPLELLLADDTLYQLYRSTDSIDRSQLIRCLAHSKPNLRILEVGAGTGGTTASMLGYLTESESCELPMYSKYTFTDISSGFFMPAKERFKDYQKMEYRTLDISKNPAEQGFTVSDKYDLILATNVIHATKSLRESLINVYQLLADDGRLLLHELNSPCKWVNYVFGLLPGWWYGEQDGRPDEPYIAPARWEVELKHAGFSKLDAVVLDADHPHHLNAIMVAKRDSDAAQETPKAVTLLHDGDMDLAVPVYQQLIATGYAIDRRQLGEDLPTNQDVIAMLDSQQPWFQDMNDARLKASQKLFDSLGSSGILWVTKPCQVQSRDPRYAQVIGVARSIRAETLIDFATCEVDDSRASLDRIVDVFSKFQKRKEDEYLRSDYEYAINDGIIHVGRIYPVTMNKGPLLHANLDDRISLDIAKPGRLTSARWTAHNMPPLKKHEVEVRFHAAGLNFKDVLGALGVVPFPEAGLGVEAAGIVTRVGNNVQRLRPGNRVVCLCMGVMSTCMVVPQDTCAKLPESLNFDEAATIPVVYATAVGAMIDIGRLHKGQSVLIHSACGGVGQAAIQVAKMVGAEIYATVGSEAKVKHLMEEFGLARNRIFNSRDSSFEQELLRETDGRGVDLALNSLSGELLHATWRCVAEFGQMVEIGMRDLLGSGKLDLDVFLGSRSYSGFYLDSLLAKKPIYCEELLERVMAYLDSGAIGPIRPTHVFDAMDVGDAFRLMQSGHHIGKVVLSLRDECGCLKVNLAAIKSSKTLNLDSSASYLMVGGLGGLGRSIARSLVENGARSLVFLSRSAGSGFGDQDFVRELESMGCTVQLVKGNVTCKQDVTRAISRATNLKGIMQCSMVLRDQAFARMTLTEWQEVTGPKVEGTWHLHNVTAGANIQLDFFVLFSSMSGAVGQVGQANYAGANTFLDSFVQYRRSLGLAASALDIGAVEDVGYLSKHDELLKRLIQQVSHAISETELMESVRVAMSFSALPDNRFETNARLGFVDNSTILLGLGTSFAPEGSTRTFFQKDRRLAVYQNASGGKKPGESVGLGSDNLKSFLAAAKNDTEKLRSDGAISFLAGEIGKMLFAFLLKSDEDLNTAAPLASIGMDSLVAVEMRNWWRQAFAFDITTLELLGMSSLDALGKHALEGLLKISGDTSS